MFAEWKEGKWAAARQPGRGVENRQASRQASDQIGPFSDQGKEFGFYSQCSGKSLMGF